MVKVGLMGDAVSIPTRMMSECVGLSRACTEGGIFEATVAGKGRPLTLVISRFFSKFEFFFYLKSLKI